MEHGEYIVLLMSTFYRQTPENTVNTKAEMSTAERFYDLEESQRRYQELVEENMWLKQQIDRNRNQGQSTPQEHQYRSYQEYSVGEEPTSNGDMVLWSMLERNRYLEDKIGKLRGQYEKQSRTLTSIRQSDKWKNRFVCSSQNTPSCYEEKYLQLLRVRSPFY